MASVTGSTCFGTECPTLGAKAEGQNLARSVRNDRPGKEAGTPERNQPMFDEVLLYPRRLAARRWHGPIRATYANRV